MTERFDLVVIGAGPAGCSVAASVNKKRTLLLDTKSFPRDKPCSGLLVEESFAALERTGIPASVYGTPKTLPLRHLDIDNGIDVLQKRTLGNVNRIKFDHWLLKLVPNTVEVWEKTIVKKIDQGKTINLHISREGEEQVIETDQLVGADGAISVTRRELGLKAPYLYKGEQDFITYKTAFNECIFVYWSKLTDWYAWILPKTEGIIETGAALQPEANRDLLLSQLRQKTGFEGEVVEKKSWRLSQPRSYSDISLGNGRNIFLVGEAAGFISPSTGEGISFGLRSGHLLADALGSENPAQTYATLATPLVQEVVDKIKKANAIANPKLRAKLLQSLNT